MEVGCGLMRALRLMEAQAPGTRNRSLPGPRGLVIAALCVAALVLGTLSLRTSRPDPERWLPGEAERRLEARITLTAADQYRPLSTRKQGAAPASAATLPLAVLAQLERAGDHLAACHGAQTAPVLHQPRSLPSAFIQAGARAVLAATDAIPDQDAGAFFQAVRERIQQGTAPAAALRDERLKWLEKREVRNWVDGVLLFD